jgi:hypothetical protein
MRQRSDDSAEEAKWRNRGVFERSPGVWWVRYADETGQVHRERVGPKGLALKVYQKRKNEVQERRFFPERIARRDMPLCEMIDKYLDRAASRLRHFYHYQRYGRYWKEVLGRKALRQVVSADIERYVGTRLKQVKPATVNRELEGRHQPGPRGQAIAGEQPARAVPDA